MENAVSPSFMIRLRFWDIHTKAMGQGHRLEASKKKCTVLALSKNAYMCRKTHTFGSQYTETEILKVWQPNAPKLFGGRCMFTDYLYQSPFARRLVCTAFPIGLTAPQHPIWRKSCPHFQRVRKHRRRHVSKLLRALHDRHTYGAHPQRVST